MGRHAREAARGQGRRQGVRRSCVEVLPRSHQYVHLDLGRAEDYVVLRDAVASLPGIRVFYLATASLFVPICKALASVGLSEGSRIVLEKPLGYDLKSSNAINDAVGEIFAEGQIYRIDHYLGRNRCRTCLRCASAMRCSSRCGAANGSRASRSRSPRPASRHAAISTTIPARCAHGAEPPAAAAVDRRDGAAAFDGFGFGARRAARAARAEAGRSARHRQGGRARPVSCGRDQGRAGAGLRDRTGREARQPDRNVRRAEGRDRELALGRRAVLPAHRQAAGRSRRGDRRQFPPGAAFGARTLRPVRTAS